MRRPRPRICYTCAFCKRRRIEPGTKRRKGLGRCAADGRAVDLSKEACGSYREREGKW